MTISVCIPAYNSASTIEATLRSVLAQSVKPLEILVVNDGSTDGTPEILERYSGEIKVLHQPNRGLGATLDRMFAIAQGDLVARLDADDLWHPRYLEAQQMLAEELLEAVAFFTGHVDFYEGEAPRWQTDPDLDIGTAEVLSGADFINAYSHTPGRFGSMSFCCVRAAAVRRLGAEPFKVRIAEDLYFLNRIARLGPMAQLPAPLAGYLVRRGSLSSNRLKLNRGEVAGLELVRAEAEGLGDSAYTRAIHEALHMKRRQLAKTALLSGEVAEARGQLARALRPMQGAKSTAKTLSLLSVSFLPQAWSAPIAKRISDAGRHSARDVVDGEIARVS